jgi:hypothetical protein
MDNIQEIIKLWKELGVEQVKFEFSCGGDSMNDTSITIEGKDGSEIDNVELRDYFDDAVYKRVEFYEASDGHYQGEFGNVYITLSDDEEDFDYNKSSQSEWSERVDSEVPVELTDEQMKFIKSKVLNINGDCDSLNVNYKNDCILSDKEEELVDDLENTLLDILRDYSPDTDEGEVGEWFTFTTNEEGEDIKFIGNSVVVQISNEVTIFRDDEGF